MNLENIELEKAVLAGMLIDIQCYFALADRLQPDAFTTKLHQAIYREIGKMADQDGRAAHRLIAHRLRDEFEDADSYVAALLTQGKTSDENQFVTEYAETIVDLHMRRMGIAACDAARKAFVAMKSDPETALLKLQEAATELTTHSPVGRRESFASVGQQVLEYADDAAQGRVSGIGWPLQAIQRLLGDIMPGELALIGANPGGGKTALMMQCAIAMARAGHPGLIFSMEMTNLNVMKRWICGAANVPFDAVDSGATTDDQFAALSDILQNAANVPLDLISGPLTAQQIRARAMAAKKQHGLRHLWVDHIKKIPLPTRYKMGIHEVVYQNAGVLADVAKDLRISVFALCHFTKEARTREDRPEPKKEDFYGGGIEEHADIMAAAFNRHAHLVDNPERIQSDKKQDEYARKLAASEGKIEFYKLKHRRQKGQGVVEMNWDGSRTMLSDIMPAQQDLLDDKTLPF